MSRRAVAEFTDELRERVQEPFDQAQADVGTPDVRCVPLYGPEPASSAVPRGAVGTAAVR